MASLRWIQRDNAKLQGKAEQLLARIVSTWLKLEEKVAKLAEQAAVTGQIKTVIHYLKVNNNL